MKKLFAYLFFIGSLIIGGAPTIIRAPGIPSLPDIFGTIQAFKMEPEEILNDPIAAQTIIDLHRIQYKPEKFNDVTLLHQLPQYFLLNEIIQIKGDVNRTKLDIYFSRRPWSQKTYSVNVVFLSQNDGRQYVFSRELQRNQTKFQIQCYFDHPDRYYMGIFIGQEAQFTPRIFEVKEAVEGEQYISQIQTQDLPPKPLNFSLQVEDNQFIIKWSPISALAKIVVSQSTSVFQQFLISNDQGYLIIPYAAFSNFNHTQTDISLAYAYTKDIGAFSRISRFSNPYHRRINVTQHHFRVYKPDLLRLQNFPSMVPLNSNIEFKGKALQKMRQEAFVIQPDNKIYKKNITASKKQDRYIPPNQSFQFNEKINEEGVYIIQINHEKGWALLNTPIYAGSHYPLLPDYSDLYPYMKGNSKIQYSSTRTSRQKKSRNTLEQQRALVLSLLNQKRKQFGQQPLEIDEQLNNLAQNHAQDMADNGFASHTNLAGKNANQRARDLGIHTPVGEVIAVNEDIQFGQYRLTRSPIHLKNMINPQWYRAGIGIAKNYQGLYYITQNFSTRDPLKNDITPEQMQEFQDELVEALSIEAKRQIKENKSFSKQIKKWHQQDWNDFDSLRKILSRNRIYKVSYQKVSLSFTHNFVRVLKEKDYLRDRGFDNVGVSLLLNERNLEIALVFY